MVENCHLTLKDAKADNAVYRPNRSGDLDDSDDVLPVGARIVPHALDAAPHNIDAVGNLSFDARVGMGLSRFPSDAGK